MSKPKTPRKSCLRISIYLLGALILIFFVLAVSVLYLQIIYVTTPLRNQNVGTFPGHYRDVTLVAADGVPISGWYVPGTRSEAIVVVHGIHANRAFLIPEAVILAEAGYHILMIDLRGHGRSGDAVMTYGYREAMDVEAAADYLSALPEVKRIGALGHSLGAAAVVHAAALDERIQTIVIQSSYSSLSDAIDDAFNNFVIFPKWPFSPLIIAMAEYRTSVKIGDVNSARDLATMSPRPVLIIHSAGDDMFPLHHAQKMYESAHEPKSLWVVDGVGHINPIHGHEVDYQQKVLNFFEEAFALAN